MSSIATDARAISVCHQQLQTPGLCQCVIDSYRLQGCRVVRDELETVKKHKRWAEDSGSKQQPQSVNRFPMLLRGLSRRSYAKQSLFFKATIQQLNGEKLNVDYCFLA